MSGERAHLFAVNDEALALRLEAERRRLHAVIEVARAMGSTLDLDRVLDMILAHTTTVMEADRSTLYLVTDDGEGLWSKITQGTERITIRLKLGQGIAGWVAAEGRTLRIDDAYDDPRFNQDVDRRSGYRTRSILCAPLKNSDGRVVGVIQVLNRKGGPFTVDDEVLLEALASQAAISIANSKLFDEAVRQNEELRKTHAKLEERVAELDLLYQVEQEMHAAQGLEEMIERLLTRAMARTGAQAGAVFLDGRPTARLTFRGAEPPFAITRSLRIAHDEGLAGWVTGHGLAVRMLDPESDPRSGRVIAEEIGFHATNLLCVPLSSPEGTLGAVELFSKPSADGFSVEDQRLLTILAGQASNVIQRTTDKEERLKESRLASIGQMLSGLIHDFKTPMTVVSGYAQMLAASDDREKRERQVAEVLRQLERMNVMTREVLSFARGESHLLLRTVMLSAFMRDIEEQLTAEFHGRNVRLVIDPGERGPAVLDESKFLRVVHNMARNAAEAMPGGGVFRIGVHRAGGKLVWTFVDNGPGIPAELEGRLFEAFATSGKPNGTGLGLAIVKKIVDDHGGTIEYASAKGKGTTFTVTVPGLTPGGAP